MVSQTVHVSSNIPASSFKPNQNKKILFSPDVMPSGWLVSKHQLTEFMDKVFSDVAVHS